MTTSDVFRSFLTDILPGAWVKSAQLCTGKPKQLLTHMSQQSTDLQTTTTKLLRGILLDRYIIYHKHESDMELTIIYNTPYTAIANNMHTVYNHFKFSSLLILLTDYLQVQQVCCTLTLSTLNCHKDELTCPAGNLDYILGCTLKNHMTQRLIKLHGRATQYTCTPLEVPWLL